MGAGPPGIQDQEHGVHGGGGGHWLGAGLSYLEATWERDNFRMLALQKAGVDVSGSDRDFQDDVGSFMSSDDYNAYIGNWPGTITRTTPRLSRSTISRIRCQGNQDGTGAARQNAWPTVTPCGTAGNGTGAQPTLPCSPW
jgi:hypothetical protein